MDKLKELEQKKKQLKELRERRHYGQGDSLVDHLLQTLQQDTDEKKNAASDMVSVSIQTDEPIEIEANMQACVSTSPVHEELIMYDKAIQTDDYYSEEVLKEDTTKEEITKEKVSEGKESSEDDAEALSKNEPFVPLPPLMIDDQQNSLHTKSFAILEALEESHSGSRSFGKLSLGSFSNFEYVNTWISSVALRPNLEVQCVSLDHHEQLLVAIFQSIPSDKYDINFTTWSHVEVFKWDTAQLVDSIEFRGQTLIKASFLRKHVPSKVVSILLTAHNGKTILYELRCVENEGSNKKMERNLILKNLFAHPVYATDEYINVPFGNDRFLAASTNGILNELNSSDLSIYKDTTSSSAPLCNIKVVPPRAADLLLERDLQEEDQSDEIGNSSEKLFMEHLLRVSLYDELAITAISISPDDLECIYVGTEDGGIYKLLLNSVVNGRLELSRTNNGFLPTTKRSNPTEETTRIFHSSHVIALSHSKQGLLMSSSLDWTCRLWDTMHNDLVASIDLGSPVICSEWLASDNHICGVVTWNTFYIIEWRVSSFIDPKSMTRRWKSTLSPEISFTITAEEASCTMFTCFKAFLGADDHLHIAIGSDSQKVHFLKVPKLSHHP